jgi:hypothetical protein
MMVLAEAGAFGERADKHLDREKDLRHNPIYDLTAVMGMASIPPLSTRRAVCRGQRRGVMMQSLILDWRMGVDKLTGTEATDGMASSTEGKASALLGCFESMIHLELGIHGFPFAGEASPMFVEGPIAAKRKEQKKAKDEDDEGEEEDEEVKKDPDEEKKEDDEPAEDPDEEDEEDDDFDDEDFDDEDEEDDDDEEEEDDDFDSPDDDFDDDDDDDEDDFDDE